MDQENISDSEFIENTRESLNSAIERWSRIEAKINEAEQIHGHVVIPAVNELRYAARPLLTAAALLTHKSDFSSKERLEVSDALGHAGLILDASERELVDSVFLLLRREFDEYSEIYSFEEMSIGFPRLSEYRAMLDVLQEKLVNARRDTSSRENIYKALADGSIDELIALREDFINSIAKSGTNRRRFESEMRSLQRTSWRWRMVALVSMIATLASLAVALGYKPINFPIGLWR